MYIYIYIYIYMPHTYHPLRGSSDSLMKRDKELWNAGKPDSEASRTVVFKCFQGIFHEKNTT